MTVYKHKYCGSKQDHGPHEEPMIGRAGIINVCRGKGQGRSEATAEAKPMTNHRDSRMGLFDRAMRQLREVPDDAVWTWEEEIDDGAACEDCRWRGETYDDAEEHAERTKHTVYVDIRKVYVWHRPAQTPPGGKA